jgi:putative acetyltransferase
MAVTVEPVGTTSSTALSALARTLVGEYSVLPHVQGRWLTIEADIAELPAPYIAPHGIFLIAFIDGAPVGCGAIHQIAPGVAEIKRVFVRPIARGAGVGETLLRALCAHAMQIGCPRVVLDTAPELTVARALYEKLGFAPCAPYHDAVHMETLYFEWNAAATA